MTKPANRFSIGLIGKADRNAAREIVEFMIQKFCIMATHTYNVSSDTYAAKLLLCKIMNYSNKRKHKTCKLKNFVQKNCIVTKYVALMSFTIPP